MPPLTPLARAASRLPRAAGVVAVAAVLIALAAASRAETTSTRNSLPFNPHPGSEHIVVGVVSGTGAQASVDADLARGLAVWAAARRSWGGIPYFPRQNNPKGGRGRPRHAQLDLLTVRAGATPASAAAAAEGLIRRRATVLVAPSEPRQLAAVAQVARRRRVLLLSASPATARRPNLLQTNLTPPRADQLDGTFSVVRKRGSRAAVLYAGKGWLARALRMAASARGHGLRSNTVDVTRLGLHRALAAARLARPDVIVAAAPLREGAGWMRRGRLAGARVPWVLISEEAARAVQAAPAGRFAVEVPWSPQTQDLWLFIHLGDFQKRYRQAYGTLPTTAAAEGATLGLTLDGMVDWGRSTDPSRMLAGREGVKIPSFWGPLTYERGQAHPLGSQLILITDGRIRQIAPLAPGVSAQAQPRLLQLSVPPHG